MAKTQTDFYAKTTRSMLSCVKEVGAMPFILFEYYLTWQTASDGIKPSLKTICDDLGLKKNVVCNLRSELIKKGWIRYENEEVFILKTFRKNERLRSEKMKGHSENLNNHSEKMNKRSEKMNVPYKEENKQRTNNENKQGERTPARDFGADVADKLFGEPQQPELSAEELFSKTVIDGLRDRLKIFNEHDFTLQLEKIWKAEIFTPEICLQTFDLLEEIRVKKRGKWKIKADYWAESIPRIETLKDELAELENGVNQNGRIESKTNQLNNTESTESVLARIGARPKV